MKEVITQRSAQNLYGRSARFDVIALDSDGKIYNVEIQRADFFKHKKEGINTMCKIMQTLQDEGREEGRAEGEKLADRRTASRLLAKHTPIAEIMELVNLSKEEIEELALQVH